MSQHNLLRIKIRLKASLKDEFYPILLWPLGEFQEFARQVPRGVGVLRALQFLACPDSTPGNIVEYLLCSTPAQQVVTEDICYIFSEPLAGRQRFRVVGSLVLSEHAEHSMSTDDQAEKRKCST